jgi:transposase-like protein
MAPGAIASHVARRFGVSTGRLYTWRKAMLLRSAACDGQQGIGKGGFC